MKIDKVRISYTVPSLVVVVKAIINDIRNIGNIPQIAEVLRKLDTIEEGAQANLDLTPLVEAIGTKADASQVDAALQTKADSTAVNSALGSISGEIDIHKTNTGNPHNTTKEQIGIRSEKGILTFNNEKQKNQLFTSGYFTDTPEVPLTLENSDDTPPIRLNVTKDGMTVKTKSKFTGNIAWVAIQTA